MYYSSNIYFSLRIQFSKSLFYLTQEKQKEKEREKPHISLRFFHVGPRVSKSNGHKWQNLASLYIKEVATSGREKDKFLHMVWLVKYG